MMQLTQTRQQTQKVQRADHHLRSSLHCSSPSRPARVELLVHLLCKHLIIYAIFFIIIVIIITIHISNLCTEEDSGLPQTMHEATYQTDVHKVNCSALSAFGLLVSSSACNFVIGACHFFVLLGGTRSEMHWLMHRAKLPAGSKNCRECSQCVSQEREQHTSHDEHDTGRMGRCISTVVAVQLRSLLTADALPLGCLDPERGADLGLLLLLLPKSSSSSSSA